MPRQCATGPQQGWQPDSHSPRTVNYINDGLDDEKLGQALGPTQPPKQKGVLVPSYRIHNEAEEYKIRMGINKPAPEKYQELDKEFSKRIADAYEQMEHNPNNPEVAAAYNALIEESIEQYRDIIANGLEVEFIPIGQPSPYRIPHEAVEDIISNRHMWVYSTRAGHGQGEKLAGNPLLAPTEFTISGQTALANDIFRVVHDYFGHAKDSIGFRAGGEENAFLSHASMYSDQAQRALATETRGQNSWLNFGPMGEANRTASEEDTVFAEQKIGLLPEEFSNPNNPYSAGKNVIEETIAGMKDGTVPGETFNMDGSRYTGGGIAVAVITENFDTQELTPELVNRQIQKFIEEHRPNEKIGVFTLEETDGETSSIDLALIIPQEQRDLAIQLGAFTRQQSLWDFDNNELIYTGRNDTGFDNRNLTMTQLRAVQDALEKGTLPDFILNKPQPIVTGGFQPASRRNSPEDILEAQRIVNYVVKNGKVPKEVEGWRSIKGADQDVREKAAKQKDELVQAAIQVMEGEMTVPKFRELVEKYNPVTAITELPTTASLADVAKALTKDKSGTKRILGLPNVNIEDGEAVGFRLDIPAYRSYDVWVNTIRHLGKKQNYYSNIAVGNNATFGDEKANTKALRVAIGGAKSPFAVINVTWENQSIQQTEQEIARALQDSQQPNSTWKQIGFNPNRSGYFYDKATFRPVASASRVLQLGPLVMAQNVRYVPTEKAIVNFSQFENTSGPVITDDGYVVVGEMPRQDSLDLQRKLGILPIGEEEFDLATTRALVPREEIEGRYMQTLLDNLTDEGKKIVAEKGIPFGVEWHYKKNRKFTGYFSASRDVVAVSFFGERNSRLGLPIYRDAERTILHEHGHLLLHRLLRMEMVNNKKVRTTTRSGYSPGVTIESENLYQDITDFTPEFSEAFIEDGIALGLIFPELKQSGYVVKNARGILQKIKTAQMNSEFYADILSNKRPRYSDTNADERFRGTLVKGGLGARDKLEKELKRQLERRNSARRAGLGLRLGNNAGQRITEILRNTSKDYQSWFKRNIEPLDYVPDTVLPSVEVMKKKIKKFDDYVNRGQTEAILNKWKKRQESIEKFKRDNRATTMKNNGITMAVQPLVGFGDIIDAMTNGQASDDYGVWGHGRSYFDQTKKNIETEGNRKLHETGANMFEAKYNIDQTAWNYMKIHIPNLVKAFDNMLAKYDGKMELWNRDHEVVKQTHLR